MSKLQIKIQIEHRKKNIRCTKKACRKRISIRKGTFFEGKKLDLGEILLLRYLWLTKKSYSSALKLIGHQSNTIVRY